MAIETEAGPQNGVRFIQRGHQVLIVWAGRLAAELDHDAALAMAAALRSVALKAEEWAKAEAIARDQAILIRSGAPIGLTSHPIIQDEAAKLAAHDRDLRRFMPASIKSEEQVGTPTIHNPGPKE